LKHIIDVLFYLFNYLKHPPNPPVIIKKNIFFKFF
jgi:hypothetical protein